ncbi:hypothetical protein BG000_010411, partial [Podila horticola]
MEKPKVLIVGAGLGGITLGILLERAGIPYEIFERAAEVKPLGSATEGGGTRGHEDDDDGHNDDGDNDDDSGDGSDKEDEIVFANGTASYIPAVKWTAQSGMKAMEKTLGRHDLESTYQSRCKVLLRTIRHEVDTRITVDGKRAMMCFLHPSFVNLPDLPKCLQAKADEATGQIYYTWEYILAGEYREMQTVEQTASKPQAPVNTSPPRSRGRGIRPSAITQQLLRDRRSQKKKAAEGRRGDRHGRIHREINEYRDMAQEVASDDHLDPLEWWREYVHRFSLLAKVARKYFSVMAS